MAHQHSHNHTGHHHHHDEHGHEHHEHKDDTVKNLRIAFFLNLTFTIIEFVGGFFSNSMAVMTDAVHDLGDTIAIGSSLFFEKYSTRGRDSNYSYGYRRYSPMAAFVNCIILILGSFFMMLRAIPALFDPNEVKPGLMLIMAVAGIIFNGLAVLKLQHGHSHHGHEHSHNSNTVKLHLMEDLLGWIAVLLGSVVIYFTGWHILDPILSIAIAVYILFNAVKGILATGKILLQAVPDKTQLQKLETALRAIPGVENVHDLHLWSLDGNYHVLTLHILPVKESGPSDFKRIQETAAQLIKNEKIEHFTIQLDWDSHCHFGDC